MNTTQTEYVKDYELRVATLPGAERFYDFLKKCYAGRTLEVFGPIAESWTEGVKVYDILADGKKVGEYRTFDKGPLDEDFGRQFNGAIPGYTNEIAREINSAIVDGPKVDECSIILAFNNIGTDFVGANLDHVVVTESDWQRRDDHPEIKDFP